MRVFECDNCGICSFHLATTPMPASLALDSILTKPFWSRDTVYWTHTSASPSYGLMILNRKDLNNLVQPLTSQVEFHLNTPFLLFKKLSDDLEDGGLRPLPAADKSTQSCSRPTLVRVDLVHAHVQHWSEWTWCMLTSNTGQSGLGACSRPTLVRVDLVHAHVQHWSEWTWCMLTSNTGQSGLGACSRPTLVRVDLVHAHVQHWSEWTWCMRTSNTGQSGLGACSRPTCQTPPPSPVHGAK
ncbi:hypothetical protein Btru_038591 [Bulinus truncatus]|nr:hypothetical protein Btru_038591 [Bulinus truncatus]